MQLGIQMVSRRGLTRSISKTHKCVSSFRFCNMELELTYLHQLSLADIAGQTLDLLHEICQLLIAQFGHKLGVRRTLAPEKNDSKKTCNF